jgi:hypothetical protein
LRGKRSEVLGELNENKVNGERDKGRRMIGRDSGKGMWVAGWGGRDESRVLWDIDKGTGMQEW